MSYSDDRKWSTAVSPLHINTKVQGILNGSIDPVWRPQMYLVLLELDLFTKLFGGKEDADDP